MTPEELYKLMQIAHSGKTMVFLTELYNEKGESLDDMEWLYWEFLEMMFTKCAGSTHEPTVNNQPLTQLYSDDQRTSTS